MKKDWLWREKNWNLKPFLFIEKGFSRLLSWTSLYAKAFLKKGSITQGHLLLIVILLSSLRKFCTFANIQNYYIIDIVKNKQEGRNN